MRIDEKLTDDAVQQEIGRRLARWRLERNQSQAEFAKQAGLSRRTIQRLEDGEAVQLPSFIRALRALGLSETLDRLLPDAVPSPVERVKNDGRRRRRARGGKIEPQSEAPWMWGDERDDRS